MEAASAIQFGSPLTPAREKSKGTKPICVAGESGRSRKSRLPASTNFGFAMTEPASFPAACHCSNVLPMKSIASPPARTIQVVAQLHFRASLPTTVAQQAAGVPVDDVSLEGEGSMRFGPRDRDLTFFAEGEDVVADQILLAIMLVKPSIANVIDQVILKSDAGAAFVGIQPPSAVARRIDVVNHVVTDTGTFRRSERVHGPHVAEDPIADVVQVVPFDGIAFRSALGVTPSPADRDGGIEKVCDVAMGDGVVGAVSDPDADRARHDPPAAVDDAVVDGYVPGSHRFRHHAGSPMRTPVIPRSNMRVRSTRQSRHACRNHNAVVPICSTAQRSNWTSRAPLSSIATESTLNAA